MRIKRLVLSGFRAFGSEASFDLDADCVIVCGGNGQGKTSLLDGLFWALTGRLERLGDSVDRVVSLYSETGGATASVTLDSEYGPLMVVRRTNGLSTSANYQLNGEPVNADRVRELLGPTIVPLSGSASESPVSPAVAMARSLYLQQDSIRDFISADTDDTRFRVVAELCGLGRVADFQATLQQERKAWSQATNVLIAEVSARRAKLDELRARASQLSVEDVSGDSLRTRWLDWWTRLRSVLPEFKAVPSGLEIPGAEKSLDRAIRSLAAARLEKERRREDVVEAQNLLQSLLAESLQADTTHLRAAAEATASTEAEARKALRTKEERNRTIQQELLRAGARAQEVRALAEIALRHLGTTCPVCDQAIDRDATGARLQALLRAASGSGPALEDLAPFMLALEVAQARSADAKEALQAEESRNAKLVSMRSSLMERLRALGVSDPELQKDLQGVLQSISDEVAAWLTEVTELRAEGDKLALARARASEVVQREEIERQVKALEREIGESDRVVVSREHASRVATDIAEELRQASLNIVDAELRRIEPLLQRIWAGIDPHPSFRAVQLVSKLSYAKGRLSMRVRDDVRAISSDNPEVVLSSSQLNALAVALFLALNLGTQSLPISATVLDDPFQSLDDINLLGLVDLLRRVSGTRQLLLTTHEERFAQLLARKFRPVREGQRTRVVMLDHWDRTAPMITEHDVGVESKPFRFVA